eukprot:16435957-Heterocapsa_arctica.AAC.1
MPEKPSDRRRGRAASPCTWKTWWLPGRERFRRVLLARGPMTIGVGRVQAEGFLQGDGHDATVGQHAEGEALGSRS